MAKAELGVKRLCLSCGMRFYDFKRSPIICPGCGVEFDPTKPRKSRVVKGASKAGSKFVVGAVDLDDDIDLKDDDLDENDDTVITPTTVGDSEDDIDFDDDIEIDNDDGPGVIKDDLDDGDELLANLHDRD